MPIDFKLTEVASQEVKMCGGPHDGECFKLVAGFVCPLLPQVIEWPGELGGEPGYNRYEVPVGVDSRWAPESRTICYHYMGFRFFDAAKSVLQAVEIVQRLAEWSEKYPRQQIHSFSAKIDEQLIEIENAAKAWLDWQNDKLRDDAQ